MVCVHTRVKLEVCLGVRASMNCVHVQNSRCVWVCVGVLPWFVYIHVGNSRFVFGCVRVFSHGLCIIHTRAKLVVCLGVLVGVLPWLVYYTYTCETRGLFDWVCVRASMVCVHM